MRRVRTPSSSISSTDLGVPREAYDGVLTSGDVAREFLAARPGT